MGTVIIGPIVEQLEELVRQMKAGEYSEADEAVLITSDKETGLLTMSCLTEYGVDEKRHLFHRMARTLNYVRIN